MALAFVVGRWCLLFLLWFLVSMGQKTCKRQRLETHWEVDLPFYFCLLVVLRVLPQRLFSRLASELYAWTQLGSRHHGLHRLNRRLLFWHQELLSSPPVGTEKNTFFHTIYIRVHSRKAAVSTSKALLKHCSTHSKQHKASKNSNKNSNKPPYSRFPQKIKLNYITSAAFKVLSDKTIQNPRISQKKYR